MLNDPSAVYDTRQPRAIIKIGGKTFHPDGSDDVTGYPMDMGGCMEWNVDNNAARQADTFSVKFAASALPADRDVAWFSQQQEISVEIFAGFPADPVSFTSDQLKSWIYGLVDQIEYDAKERVIELRGRDLTAKMIDTKTSATYLNRTASDIASMMATKYGLIQKITATSKMAGKFYELVHAHTHHDRSEWDLLCLLAQHENFQVYVQGRELHFEPQPTASGDKYLLRYASDPAWVNAMDLSFSRGLTFAKGLQITVKSAGQRGQVVTAIYPKKAGKNAQQRTYTFPNLDPERAMQKAQALYLEAARHEINLQATMPADDLLTARTPVQVTGTGTNYDQIYFPVSVRRSMTFDGGYTMSLHANNLTAQAQAGAQ